MRRVIGLLLSVVFLFGYAYAEEKKEITFQGVPWLVDEEVSTEILVRNGFIRSTAAVFSDVQGTYLMQDETGFVWPSSDSENKDVLLTMSLFGKIKEKIGGCYARDIIMSYAYNGSEANLIAVDVRLYNIEFDDIKAKIEKVYGEGKVTYSDEIIRSIIWMGDNDSCILLYTEGNTTDFNLVYGRLNAEEILKQCHEMISSPVVPDDVSGL